MVVASDYGITYIRKLAYPIWCHKVNIFGNRGTVSLTTHEK